MTSIAHVVVMDRWKVPLVAAFICLGVSMLLAATKVAIRGGFGAGDLLPFFLWTIPLSLFIAFAKNGLVGLLRARSLALTYAVSGTTGIVAGVLWTYLVAFWLGPYFGAFSFEVLSCWVVGATSGLIVTSKYFHGTGRSLLISITIIVMIWLVGLAGDRPLLRLLSDSREVEVVAVKWRPGSQPLSNPPVLGMKLADADLELLKSIELTGQVEFMSSGVFGEGKRGKAIIVISQQLNQPATLRQPDGGNVIYLQTPEGWKMYPPNAVALGRNIHIWADEREPDRVTRYYVENADGSRQGGTLMTW